MTLFDLNVSYYYAHKIALIKPSVLLSSHCVNHSRESFLEQVSVIHPTVVCFGDSYVFIGLLISKT